MNTVTRGLRLAALLGVVVAMCVAGTAVATAGEPGFPEAPVIAPDVLDAVHEEGRASVIVQLAEPVRPEGTLQGVLAGGAQSLPPRSGGGTAAAPAPRGGASG